MSAGAGEAPTFAAFSENPSKVEMVVRDLVEKHDAVDDPPRFHLHPNQYMRLDDGRYFVNSFTGLDCYSELDFVNPEKALVAPLGDSGTVVQHSTSKAAEWWLFSSGCVNHGSGRTGIYAVVRFAAKRDTPMFRQLVDISYSDNQDPQTGTFSAPPSLETYVCDIKGNGNLDVVVKITNQTGGVTHRSFIFSKQGFTEQGSPHTCP
jgi:hypothetical protein